MVLVTMVYVLSNPFGGDGDDDGGKHFNDSDVCASFALLWIYTPPSAPPSYIIGLLTLVG